MASCTSCGAALPEGLKFCTSCGAAAMSAPPAPQYAPPPPAAPPKRKGLKALLIFLVLALLLSVGTGVLMLTVFKGATRQLLDGSESVITTEAPLQTDPPAQNTQPSPEPHTEAPTAAANASGEDYIFTAQWPDNQFTRQVPKPEFEVSFGSVSETEYSALGGGVTVEQLREYTKKLQKAGFSKNAETTDESIFGMTTYTYKADNGKGYQVEVSYVSMMNINAISIRKIA